MCQPPFALYSFSFALLELQKRVIALSFFSLYSHLYAYSDIFLHALFLSLNSIFICNIGELLKRVINLPNFSFYPYLFADLDIVLDALFLGLKPHCISFYLQLKEASIMR